MSRPFRWRVAAAAGLGALAAAFPVLAAGAIGTGGAESFGLNPAPLPDGRAESYFNLAADRGQSATATVILSDLGHKTEKLKLSPSLGVTAANGGIGYSVTSGPCSGPSCWLAGIGRTVTLAPGTREQIPFTVRVPAGTPHRQYLAGITAELANKPKATWSASTARRPPRPSSSGRSPWAWRSPSGTCPRCGTGWRSPASPGRPSGPCPG